MLDAEARASPDAPSRRDHREPSRPDRGSRARGLDGRGPRPQGQPGRRQRETRRRAGNRQKAQDNRPRDSRRQANSRPAFRHRPIRAMKGNLMPSMPIDVGDAIELAELLQFLSDWMESDRENLAGSLARFVGSPVYGPGSLRDDFARFRFLLGVTDGEGVFIPDAP